MRITVCGCGKIGKALIDALSAEGHDITVVDNDQAVLSEITNVYDVIGVCGNAADCDTLKDAGTEETELFVAATGSDELNMLSCFLAGRMGAGHTIARIRNPEYNDDSLGFLKKELGLSMAINPERLTARELFDILKMPSAAKVESLGGFRILEIKLREGTALDGISLQELRMKYKARVLVCTVLRGDEVFIPRGDFVLKAGDRIGITSTVSEIEKFLKITDLRQKQVKSAMILGGSKTSFYLSKMLTENGVAVKIIERDVLSAALLADLLPDASIIRGDGAQQELLLEEGIDSTDAFVTLTGMDEENILVSIYASSREVPKVITKINREEMFSMAERLGLDCVVCPTKIMSDVLVRYARALENSKGSRVEALYKLMDGRAEALEFVATESEGLTGKPLKSLKLKPNVLIAGITRSKASFAPTGDDMIMPGDRVVVIAAGHRLADLHDILA